MSQSSSSFFPFASSDSSGKMDPTSIVYAEISSLTSFGSTVVFVEFNKTSRSSANREASLGPELADVVTSGRFCVIDLLRSPTQESTDFKARSPKS